MTNKDPGTPEESFLAWLMQDVNSTPSSTAEASVNSEASLSARAADQSNSADLDPLDSEVMNALSSALSDLEGSRRRLELGDIPAVQDRFYALVKRRLQAEMEANPPLFPWEAEVASYEVPEMVRSQAPGNVWLEQLRALKLPMRLPEPVLAQLFAQCQQALQSSLKKGAKLVSAVEGLFPGEDQSLNQLAGLMLMSPSRSPQLQALAERQDEELGNYETATSTQQMVLSLLAAREIIGSLTLSPSPLTPLVERQWLTAAGLLDLRVNYQVPEDGAAGSQATLQVQCILPCSGRLQLSGTDVTVSAQCSRPGAASVELVNPQPGQTYPLEIQLNSSEEQPLVFSICPVEAE